MVECDHCEYEWEYGGEMIKATCPSCQRKTEVADGE
jgi:Zn finger protein HypA/HybF involved in hydrogenase expression